MTPNSSISFKNLEKKKKKRKENKIDVKENKLGGFVTLEKRSVQ